VHSRGDGWWAAAEGQGRADPASPRAGDKNFPLRVRFAIEGAMSLLYELEDFDRDQGLQDSSASAEARPLST
jgi:hypothetical protein